MKKIKRIRDLREEQEKLAHRQKELKQLIHSDWVEIREAAKLKNILKKRLQLEERQAKNEKPWIERLTNHAGLFARKIVQQAEKKIEMKMSEKVESVLNHFFAKRN